MNVHLKSITIATLLLLPAAQGLCQEDTSKYPTTVLVQLSSEQNRIKGLARAGRPKDLEEVKQDAEEVRKHIIADFTAHFNYCPVYYFSDTNLQAIKDKHFDGILFRADGSPANNVIKSGDTDYVIAYYGYPISQRRIGDPETDTSKYVYDPQEPFGRGLVVLNDQFLQVTYFYKFGYDELFFGRHGKEIRDYVYKSRHFDIQYYPCAGLFNKRLLDRTNIRHVNRRNALHSHRKLD